MIRFLFGLVFLLLWSCTPPHQNGADAPVFELVGAEKSGLDFENILTEDNSINIIKYLYAYNGGGVAVADLNGDALPDIYFSANQTEDQLYLNQGNFKFKNATKGSGLEAKGHWKTGVSMADVNGDGFIDIYVCEVGGYQDFKGKNRLLINKGEGRFEDQAMAWGVDVSALSTQATFLDFDNDNDLDMFLVCASVHSPATYRDTSERRRIDPLAADRLFRNDGQHFTDVSLEMGILQGRTGYGLGVVVADFNEDQWPDIFVGNDFHDNDYLYLNQAGKYFKESSNISFGHSSYFSMGAEAADLNNDGLMDLLSMDMKPNDEQVLKASEPANPYNIYLFKLKFGYLPQFSRNMLQMHQGVYGPQKEPLFTELAQFYGIAATDWSWSVLAADFDNDGFKDIHITNGILRRPNDLDFQRYLSNPQVQNSQTDLDLIRHIPTGNVSNVLYKNNAGQRFKEVTEISQISRKSISSGAAYADFDLDGDLDLVVNNLNEKAFLYKNLASDSVFSLQFDLVGPLKNTKGIGAKVWIWQGGKMQYNEMQPCRGFQSSVEPILHFGLGAIKNADSVRVLWPDGKAQLLLNVAAGRRSLRYVEASPWPHQKPKLLPLFSILEEKTIAFAPFVDDTEQEKLIPYQCNNRFVPFAFAKNKTNPNFYLGNGDFYPSGEQKNFAYPTSNQLDVAATLLDADGDGDLDLYTAGASLTGALPTDLLFFQTPDAWQLKQTFERNARAAFTQNWDFDTDGDPDIAVGQHSIPNAYGKTPVSFLLRNDKGVLQQLPTATLPLLQGLPTAATLADINADNRLDLVIVGHWMPISWIEYKAQKFILHEIPNSTGLWNCVLAQDFDNNGQVDLLAGNLGLNHYFSATGTSKVQLHAADFDANGALDPIISYYRQGKQRTLAARDELAAQIPYIKKRFPKYLAFANADLSIVLSENKEKVTTISTFASCIFYNQNSTFEALPLPDRAQWGPINCAAVFDFNSDEKKDLVLAGNQMDWIPIMGRLDGMNGLVLENLGPQLWQPLPNTTTGLFFNQQIHALAFQDGKLLARSNKGLYVYDYQKIIK